MRRLEKDDIEVLKAAQDIISDEANWCQKSMARNCLGKSTPVDFCQPCRWCATGAVYLAAKRHFRGGWLTF